jgi:hypothetical protein
MKKERSVNVQITTPTPAATQEKTTLPKTEMHLMPSYANFTLWLEFFPFKYS